jgi:hypothetical protein
MWMFWDSCCSLWSCININGLRPFHFLLFEDYAMIPKGGRYIKNQMPGFALFIFRCTSFAKQALQAIPTKNAPERGI